MTTCFEAFLGLPGHTAYWEINLAANGDWNVYSFDDYRSGQQEQPLDQPPTVALRRWQTPSTATGNPSGPETLVARGHQARHRLDVRAGPSRPWHQPLGSEPYGRHS